MDCFGNTLLDLADANDTLLALVEKGDFNMTWPVFMHPFKFKSYRLPGAVAKPWLSGDGEVLDGTPGLSLYYKMGAETKE